MELVANRECGKCVVCCKVLTIDDPQLQKLPGVMCGNCKTGSGCKIYDTRPDPCRGFFCGWRYLRELDDKWRPDKSGVMIRFQDVPPGYQPPGFQFLVTGHGVSPEKTKRLYDLARAGRVSMGDLRYYHEARLSAFGSPLAQAQLGAALALYGDPGRAQSAFEAAIAGLSEPEKRSRTDYGTKLRDTAGVLALAAEFKPAGVDLTGLTTQLAKLRDRKSYTSTQEDSWTLLAAAALGQASTDGSITMDGEALTGQVYQSYEQMDFAPVEIANTGESATEAKVTVTGYPSVAPEETSNGFTLIREYFKPDGTPVDIEIDPIAQNDRFVVVLTVRPEQMGSGQYVVADPLPAGFEIENPDLSAGGGVADFSWLQLDSANHVESRTDQYVAAFRYYSDEGSFQTAYLVRAVSPGTFVLPGTTVEDMYRPEYRANTAAGTIVVSSTGP